MNRSDLAGKVRNDVALSHISGAGVGRVVPLHEEKNMEIMHDGSLSIATADSRKAVHWKNKDVLWSELVEKLSKTKRTAETQAEYATMPKTKQDEIKDVGGFVGGILKEGRRKAGNVSMRSILTLDADTPSSDLWDTFTLMYDCAACIYSTHKHTPEKPRLRLVIPLSRPVSSTEYEAISRKITFVIGIDAFDDTTYEAERLMYWPSTSIDGEYYFQYRDEAWLNPDVILVEYDNWQDRTQWPVSSRTESALSREMKKAGDPVEKHGIVGAFCRSYDIHEAIEELLSDYYEKCEDDGNRYTYRAGSTAGGVITYDGKWAYSHHGTDPASGKLCNAFDLVRVHKFGQLDEAAKPGTPTIKLPSYIAMQEFATKDEKVKMTLGRERLQSALDDFGDVPEGQVENDGEGVEWITQLKVEKNGTYSQTIENTEMILVHDPRLKSAQLKRNDFSHAHDVTGVPPWPKPNSELRVWSDYDYAELLSYLERYWGITSERVIRVALKNVFSRQRYHPVKDHLNTLVWDGINRVDTLLVEYLGAEDNSYTRAVTRKTLVAAVARVFQPGIKFDYVLVIVGPQGIGKSMLVQGLGYARHEGREKWYSDNFSLSGRGDKRDIEQLLGVWLMEIPELASLYGKNADAIKSFLSTHQDEARLAYKEEKGYFPRQCIFIGTTNNIDFLTDTTGNRRFWPVVANKKAKRKSVKDDLPKEVDQIWAEAVQMYKAGEALYLDDPKLEAFANAMQEQHREKDAWEDTIAAFLETPAPPDYWENPGASDGFATDTEDWVLRDKVTVEQLYRYALGEYRTIDTIPAKRIRKIMRAMPGWEEYVSRAKGIQVRMYRRTEATNSSQELQF